MIHAIIAREYYKGKKRIIRIIRVININQSTLNRQPKPITGLQLMVFQNYQHYILISQEFLLLLPLLLRNSQLQ